MYVSIYYSKKYTVSMQEFTIFHSGLIDKAAF